ncbi:hypothetical protein BDZ94DRAFT_50951 [Collybia nuda]|uniref:F-box domain-containing protein n=1 Tax=Collybia nuda TaxID=64659 RepID=A0A9P5YE97_9AGAR|nr:hypothetical protein BDZ94DRAFT_50951 [Collybia nuda]
MPSESVLREDKSNFTIPHWFSYTQTTLGNNKICAISVVLDAGAQEFFSGIRVIIVRKEGIKINPVGLRYCFDTFPWRDSRRPSQNIFSTHRGYKADHRQSQAQSRRLIAKSPHLPGHLPLCTIVFELQDSGTDEDPSVCLTMRSDSNSDAPLRIMYDHAIPDKVFLAFLESNNVFRNIDMSSEGEDSMFFTRYHGKDSCITLRVLPVSGPRKPFPRLPFEIIRRIAEEAFADQIPGWRASLLSCALVCKSWYPLIDMFFDTLGLPPHNNRLSLRKVSNSLVMQPEKGRLIKRVDVRNFYPTHDDSEHTEFLDGLILVLRMSVFVKEVLLCAMPSTFMHKLLNALVQLKQVEMLMMYTEGSHHPILGRIGYPSIIDTQRSIANWKELRALKLSSWEEPRKVGAFCEAALTSRLEDLWLRNGSLTDTQLLWFASPYSKIHNLDLLNILGLSNTGLLALFDKISPTLEFLSITGSTVSRKVDEAYALDVAMPKMKLLRIATIDGDFLTHLSISAKPKTHSPSTQNISIYQAPRMNDTEALLKAFETTGWDVIELTLDDALAWNNDTQGRARQAAQENGIRLALHIWD